MTDDESNDIETTDEQETTGEQATDGQQAEPAATDGLGPTVTRRGILTTAGILGLMGVGASTASADAQGSVGTSSDPLNTLYAEEINGGVTGDQSLTSVTGDGLTIGSNTLKLDIGSGLTFNSGTLKTSGGSSTSKLETSGNGDTALQVVDGATDVSNAGSSIDAPNIVGGHPDNTTNSSSPKGVTISGGGSDGTFKNIASANYATVGGGQKCEATDKMATVSGGNTNEATKRAATVSGGELNTAKAQGATVVGGNDNDAEGQYSTVFGGHQNKATSESAVAAGASNIALGGKGAAALGGISNRANSKAAVAVGGENNDADANHSLVAGRSAESNGNAGSFVWGDSSSTTVTAGAADEVRFQATGGFVVENGNVDAQGGTIENSATESSLTIQNDTNDNTANSYKDLTLKTVDTGNNNYPGDIVLDADPNNNDSRKISLKTGGTERATVDSNGLAVKSGNVDAQGGTVENSTGSLTVKSDSGWDISLSPGSDVTLNGPLDTNGKSIKDTSGTLTLNPDNKVKITPTANDYDPLQVTDMGGNDLLLASAQDHRLEVYDGDASNHLRIAHTGSNALIAAANSGDNLVLSANGNVVVEDKVRPNDNESTDLGASSNAWKDIYSKNAVTTTSDARLKDTVSDLTDGYEKVRSMRPVSYKWAEERDSDTHLGFLAQEIEEIVPEAVDRPDDEDGHLGLRYQELIPVVVSALQEQQSITSDLEADLDAKDARIENQQDRIERLESKVDNKDVTLDALREALDDKDERIADLEAESADLRAENEQLRERNAELEDRLATVEAELGIDATASQQGVADD